MQSLENSSISIDKESTIFHQTLELFQGKKWQLIDELISKEPNLLMVYDIANNPPLISKILLSQGNDKLINLQKVVIDKYLRGMHGLCNPKHDPYIQTFLKYKDSKETNNSLKLFNDRIIYGDFNCASFISTSPAFKFICELGENNLISALKRKFIEQDKGSPDVLKSLISNAINSLLYSNDKKSDPNSAKILLQTTILLNDMIKHYSEKPVVQMEIKNDIDRDYISIEFDQNIIVKSSLEVSFIGSNIEINNFNENDNYYNLIDLYNGAVIAIGKQFSWYTGQVQVADPALNIKFSLWNLGHPDNNSEDIDDSQENLHQLFNDLFHQDSKHQFFDDLTDATSELWFDIYNLGYGRGRLLLQYLLPEKQQKSFIESLSAVPKQFFLGQKKTLQTFLTKKLAEDESYMKKCIIVRLIRSSILMNDLEGMSKWIEYAEKAPDIVEHSLAIAVATLNIDAADKLLETYPRAIIDNNNEYSRNLFTVLYEHSQSQLMNDKSYRNAVNAMAVKLLEYGYPINLIERAQGNEIDKTTSDFIQDLLTEQAQYSIKKSAINWISNSLQHIPFINVITKYGADALKTNFTIEFLRATFSKSHNAIQSKLAVKNDNKIDISNFCYIFASKLKHEKNFITKLENITFLKNLKKDSFNRQSLLSGAYALSRISPENFDRQLNIFNTNIPQPITSEEISKHIYNKKINSIVSPNNLDRNFLLYRLNKYKPIQKCSTSQKNNVCEYITNGLAIVGAGAITTGAFVVNEGNMAMFLKCSIMMNLLCRAANDSRVVYTILSIAISYYILQKFYQPNVDLRNYIMQQLQIPALQNLHQEYIENTTQKISDEEIHNFIKNLFNKIYNDEFITHQFITQETFFKLIKNSRINSQRLSNDIDILKSNPQHNESFEAINDIAEALSLSVQNMNEKSQGEILPVLRDNYENQKRDLYLYLFVNCQKIEISKEQRSDIKNDIFMNFIFNLSMELKNCKGIEDVVSDIYTKMITEQSKCSSRNSTYIS